MSYRPLNCIHYILPSSLNRPPLTNEQYAAYFTPLIPAFQNFHVRTHDIIVDEAARKVVVHASSTATTALGLYGNEYMIIPHMIKDGRKVEKFYELVDSVHSKEFMPRLRDALAGQQRGEGNGGL